MLLTSVIDYYFALLFISSISATGNDYCFTCVIYFVNGLNFFILHSSWVQLLLYFLYYFFLCIRTLKKYILKNNTICCYCFSFSNSNISQKYGLKINQGYRCHQKIKCEFNQYGPPPQLSAH